MTPTLFGRRTDVRPICTGRGRHVRPICMGRGDDVRLICMGRGRDVRPICTGEGYLQEGELELEALEREARGERVARRLHLPACPISTG